MPVRLACWSLWALVCFAGCAGEPVAERGAGLSAPEPPVEVRLSSGAVVLDGDLDRLLGETTGPRYWLAATRDDPDHPTRDRLATRGWRLLSRVRPRLWWVRVEAGATSAPARDWVRAAGPLPPERKILGSIGPGPTRAVVVLQPDRDGSELLREGFARGALPGWLEGELGEAEARALAARPEVRYVAPLPDDASDRPTGDRVRARIGVEDAQAFVLVGGAPSYDLGGDGVTVGIWDNGTADPAHPDFAGRLDVGAAPPRSHATGVTAIVGGSGEASEGEGGEAFQWRGMAPLASLISRGGTRQSLTDAESAGWIVERGMHLSNTSLATHQLGQYDPLSVTIDALARGAGGGPHLSVMAAANNGQRAQYGVLRGYYSTLANAKNALVVGASYFNEDARLELSSMGPTQDGRIAPQLMAPNARRTWPTDGRPVAIDWIRFEAADSSVVASLEMDAPSDLDGWRSVQNCSDFAVASGQLTFLDRLVGITMSPDALGVTGAVRVRIRVSVAGGLDPIANRIDLRWGTSPYCTDRCRVWSRPAGGARQDVMPDGTMHEYVWDLPVGETIEWLRITPHQGSAENATFGSYDEETGAWGYGQFGQTSGAAPIVTGATALLLEELRRTEDLDTRFDYLPPALLRALLIDSAQDLVHETPWVMDRNSADTGEPITYGPGPDYPTGWGQIDLGGALEAVRTGSYRTAVVAEGAERRYALEATAGQPLHVTLAWDDPQADLALPDREPQLVHDLDLEVQTPSGARVLPLVLTPPPIEPYPGGDPSMLTGVDPITPSDLTDAVEGEDHLNNVERVLIEAPAAGTYTVVVRAPDALAAAQSQPFALVASGPLADPATCAPAPEVCDGQDDDCDGVVDEETGDRAEGCDMIDDDCDGSIDEGCPCVIDRPCRLTGYTCDEGLQRCDFDFLACEPPAGCEPIPDAGPMAMPDGGAAPVDAGTETDDGGCGCRAAGRSEGAAPWWLLLAVMPWRRRRGRH